MATARKKISLEGLIQRATSGRKFNRHELFRPSLSYYLLKDPFWLWCEHHAPQQEAVDETTRYDELRMQQGVEYEQHWVKRHYPNAVAIEPSFGFEALKNTFRAMLDGAPAIYQPHLWDLGQDTYGKGDLLIRDDSSASDLGPFHYRVVELKRSQSLREYHVLQAAFYNQNVGLLQGLAPRETTIVLKNSIETVLCNGQDPDLESIRRLWKALRDGERIPETRRPPNATSSPWRLYGNQHAATTKDLVLLAGIAKPERDKLRKAAIERVDQLWQLRQDEIVEILGEHYGAIAYHVAQAYQNNGPIMKPGEQLTIPRAKRLLYFDFETTDAVHPAEPPHTYLIGCYDGSRDHFVRFLTRGAEDEERIFAAFVDYVGDPRDVCLYHWTDFEIHQIRRVMGRWPMLANSLEQIILHCVDLKKAIQAAVYLPVPTFSIKSVAPALGFHWRQKDIGAYRSMVCYWDYLENRDLFAIDPALIYNEDDCRAMWHVDQELQTRLKGLATA
ncbi:MAG TPA: TM0106 family RecB-like putative nuclease [Verrucomicrobiae bacterium]|nr:TM0106 family RecB-like putative nuclease [Verrucomicrobiae bacterium]